MESGEHTPVPAAAAAGRLAWARPLLERFGKAVGAGIVAGAVSALGVGAMQPDQAQAKAELQAAVAEAVTQANKPIVMGIEQFDRRLTAVERLVKP